MDVTKDIILLNVSSSFLKLVTVRERNPKIYTNDFALHMQKKRTTGPQSGSVAELMT